MRPRRDAITVWKHHARNDPRPWEWVCVRGDDHASHGWLVACAGDDHASHEVAMTAARAHALERHGVRL